MPMICETEWLLEINKTKLSWDAHSSKHDQATIVSQSIFGKCSTQKKLLQVWNSIKTLIRHTILIPF